MSPSTVIGAGVVRCFPRVSGDEPEWGAQYLNEWWFSPRERG